MEAEQLPSPPVAEPTKADPPEVEVRKSAPEEEERREPQLLERQMIPA